MPDPTRDDGISVSNTSIGLTVPASLPIGLPTGPVRVVTPGGTSDTAGPTFTGLAAATATAGQTITLNGTGFDANSEVVFQVVNTLGQKSQVLVKVATATATGATAVVPATAITGVVRVLSDQNATAAPLAIVPVVTGLTVQSVASDGSTATVVLTGSGFVEGASSYTFGATTVVDSSANAGPRVSQTFGTGGAVNGQVTLTVPLSNGAFGPVTATTAGGTSAAYSVTLTSITATATTGVPADATVASANPGQSVTLNGAGLTATTAVLLHYSDQSGTARLVSLTPSSAAADGTSAVVAIPAYANGSFRIQVFGASGQPVLQIVPVLNGFTASGTNLALIGAGLVEAGTTYRLPGSTITDTSATAGPDVVYGNTPSVENGLVNVGAAKFGFGSITVTTVGGTSAALSVNALSPGLGTLADLAVDAAGAAWVADSSGIGNLHKIDVATGAELASIALTTAGFGTTTTYSGVGLQVVPAAFTLGTVNVPAGSLLLFEGGTSPDRVVAINPNTGNVVTSLTLPLDYNATAGLYDKATGHLFVIDRRTTPTRIAELNPATGASIANFAAPFNANGEAGLALNPTTGNLWYGSEQSGNVVELSKTGTVLQTIALAGQGVTANTITGLSFDAAGKLLVSTSQGLVDRVTAG